MRPDPGLRYEATDPVARSVGLGLGLQLAVLSLNSAVLLPTIVFRAADAEGFLLWAVFAGMLACGVMTAVQAVRPGRLGAGYQMLHGASSPFIAVCVVALVQGGPSMLATLVVVSGLVQAAFSERLALLHRILTPVVMLMGSLTVASGMSRDLYLAANLWLARIRGGLAAASIVACAGFSALSGSSLAAALTMGRVALPEMRRFNYDKSLAAGAVAAGGTLGILIPPSAGLVLYGILTEQSIGRLFMAGLLPGILLAALFVLTVVIIATVHPERAPRGDPETAPGKRGRTPAGAWWILGLAVVTLGGIYAGVFSAMEAAGVGAFLALLAALARRSLTRDALGELVLSTLRACGTVFLILIGAYVFKVFLGFTGTPFAMARWVGDQGWSGPQVVALVLAMFIVLGTFLDGFAILVLTIPLVQPILTSLGVDMIWFGVMIVITLEMGLISPPVGLNTFVVKVVAPDVPMGAIFRGIISFWFAMLAMLVLLALAPGIATFLPQAMFG